MGIKEKYNKLTKEHKNKLLEFRVKDASYCDVKNIIIYTMNNNLDMTDVMDLVGWHKTKTQKHGYDRIYMNVWKEH